MRTAVAVEADGLGRRYGAHWALRDCTLSIPTGTVTGLVGANGAGKTTLLHLAVGLMSPSEGGIHILGWSARTQAHLVLPRVGFVAQERPLYRGFTLADMLTMGRQLNSRWDQQLAVDRLERLGLRLAHRVGELSGGEQAQVALTLALAKGPELLILDEPVAALDPLARREFLQSLMEAVADTGMTVLLSSHILSDLERVCDQLVILAAGGVQLTGSIEEIGAGHRLLTGPRISPEAVLRMGNVITGSHTERQSTLLVRSARHLYGADWLVQEATLEEITLAYLGQPSPFSCRPQESISTIPTGTQT